MHSGSLNVLSASHARFRRLWLSSVVSQLHIMRTILTLLLAMVTFGVFAQEQPVAARRILPEDIEHASIQMVRFSTSSFAVRFSYTEAGAKKALASWETDPKHPVMSADWKAGWMKRRTDKCFFQSESAATEFMKNIKSK